MTATIKLCCAAVVLLPLLPACAAPPARSKPMETRVVAKAAKPVELRAAPTTVKLAPVTRASGRALHLVVRGLRVDEDPGVVYHVYVGQKVVGSINFYGVPPGASPDRIFYSFDVPKDAGSVVRIVPEAPVAAGAKASIARLELIEE